MTLENVLKEIQTLLPIANEVVEGNFLTLTARRGRKAQAQERLKQLKADYANLLRRSAVYVVAVGEQAEEFCKSAEKFAGFTNDPEQLFKDIGSRVAPALYQNATTVTNIFDVLGRHLEDKMHELGVSEYPLMTMKQAYARTVASVEDVTGLIKQAICEQVGGELVGLQACAASVDRAIERNHIGTTLVLLPTQDETLAQVLTKDLQRLTPNVFGVAAGKTPKTLKEAAAALPLKKVTEEAVEAALKTIKSLKK